MQYTYIDYLFILDINKGVMPLKELSALINQSERDDPEALSRTQGMLAALGEAGIVSLYTRGGEAMVKMTAFGHDIFNNFALILNDTAISGSYAQPLMVS
ncbi:hypothetical protein LJC27_03735 [Christensenellaceae bacterium OttesenSCG-928-M15]|nr:hypothetical protein [Christensenellaceae bacterium OttesenSCG-928-M15]